MSQTGTPTEFLKLGITEPDDTLNVLVDLNGQWQKIDTGVKNVDTKANTNASGITALNTAVQDNTENITNILETNVNQQTSIDTLQSKVATLEEDDTSYGSRITAVEAGVQENSELINDLEVDLSGVKTSVGTVPSGSTLQGQVDGLDTRVTSLENSGSVAAVEARVTTLETKVGTVPAGETVQGQINGLDTDVTALQGQVNSGNIPFRFSVDGGGNYGYLKADDSFVPFSVGDEHWHVLDTSKFITQVVAGGYDTYGTSYVYKYSGYYDSSSPYYHKLHDVIHNVDYTMSGGATCIGNIIIDPIGSHYLVTDNGLTTLTDTVVGVSFFNSNKQTHYLTKNGTNFQYNVVDVDGNGVGLPVSFTINNFSSTSIALFYPYINENSLVHYALKSSGTAFKITLNTTTGQSSQTQVTGSPLDRGYFLENIASGSYDIRPIAISNYGDVTFDPKGHVVFNPIPDGPFTYKVGSNHYYYL